MRMRAGRFKVQKEDLVLLCTDGLYHEVREEEMASILIRETKLKEKFDSLLQAALDGGGHDNITMVGLMI